MSDKLLTKFFNTPGICSEQELNEVKLFLENFNDTLKMYRTASGHEPAGFTIDSELDKVKWYLQSPYLG